MVSPWGIPSLPFALSSPAAAAAAVSYLHRAIGASCNTAAGTTAAVQGNCKSRKRKASVRRRSNTEEQGEEEGEEKTGEANNNNQSVTMVPEW